MGSDPIAAPKKKRDGQMNKLNKPILCIVGVMSISKICKITEATMLGIILLAVSTSCQSDSEMCGNCDEVEVGFQKGCVVRLAGMRYKLSDHINGALENEVEFARLQRDLQKYDKDKTRFFIDADREMTHMEFHTCMMGFTCGPFKMYRRNENMHNIAVHAIPLEASWCYRAVDKKDGAYYSFVLCDDKPFSRWDESVRVTEQEGFIDGIDRMLAVCRKSPELPYQVPAACPFVDIRCLVTMKVGLLLDFIDMIAAKGYERVFVGLLWKPDGQSR